MIRASILALMLSATSAFAQSNCGPITDALAWLDAQHFVAKSGGNIDGGKVVVYVNAEADWLIIAMNAEVACIVNGGKGWELLGVDA